MNPGSLLICLGHVLVFFLEQCLDLLSSFGDFGASEGVLGEDALFTILISDEVDRISSGHYMRIVNRLDERLDARSLLNLGLLHTCNNLARIPIDAGYGSMAELAVTLTLITANKKKFFIKK